MCQSCPDPRECDCECVYNYILGSYLVSISHPRRNYRNARIRKSLEPCFRLVSGSVWPWMCLYPWITWCLYRILGRNPFPSSSSLGSPVNVCGHGSVIWFAPLWFCGFHEVKKRAVDFLWNGGFEAIVALIWWKTYHREGDDWRRRRRQENCPEFRKNFVFALEISYFGEIVRWDRSEEVWWTINRA